MKRAFVLYEIAREDIGSLPRLADVLPYTSRVQVRWNGDRIFEFQYDKEMEMIVPRRGDFQLFDHLELKPYGSANFLQTLTSLEVVTSIAIELALEILKILDIKTYLLSSRRGSLRWCFDYPRMITDLEQAQLISVRPSMSMMALDSRKFSFGTEFLEVDCLGLAGFEDISTLVCEKWKHLKKVHD